MIRHIQISETTISPAHAHEAWLGPGFQADLSDFRSKGGASFQAGGWGLGGAVAWKGGLEYLTFVH